MKNLKTFLGMALIALFALHFTQCSGEDTPKEKEEKNITEENALEEADRLIQELENL